MVVHELWNKIKTMLAGVENGSFEATEIVREVLDLSHVDFILSKREVTPAEEKRACEMAQKRLFGIPLQYILGYTEFMSLKFFVDEYTLIPRQDTEILAEEIIKLAPRSVLDIGTGSGALGISIGRYVKNTEVTCLDISSGALALAEKNAVLNGVKANFLLMDIMQETPPGDFDCIVSNPPYIRSGDIGTLQKEVRCYEPLSALDGGEDGLDFYRRITDIAPKILTNDGLLAFEVGFDQAETVAALMETAFYDVRTIKDLSGVERVVIGRKK